VQSKSFCQPKMRKLLTINSPDEEEARKNEKKVLETLTKAIESGVVNNLPKLTQVIKLASVNLTESNKTRVRTVIKGLAENYKYTGESIKDIEECSFLVVKQESDGKINSLKFLYAYFFIKEVSFLSYNFFLDSQKKKVDINDYIITNYQLGLDKLKTMKEGNFKNKSR
jgi:hypothetical protein